ncbi:MAG: response regulator [Bacteroidetes bacterium]|nr:MAG: response regulator [Bacteroidota bacterium]
MKFNQKILIVDDRPENLFALQQILSEIEHLQIIKALNGNDALKATLNHEFSLAILDVQMPHMDGYELADFIRSDQRNRYLPIIFLSAVMLDEVSVYKGYQAGGVDFISKPFSPQILLGKVNNFLEIDRQKQAIKEQNKELNEMLKKVNFLNQELEAQKQALDQTAIVLILNMENRITYLNDNFCKLLGTNREDLLGKSSKVIRPKYLSENGFYFARATLLNGKIWRGEVHGESASGKEYWIDLSIVPFADDFGKYQFLGIGFEITHRKLAQRQLIEKNEEVLVAKHELDILNEKLKIINTNLEEKVQEQTQTLRQINAELYETNQELDLFIYRTSHDLRGPVANVLGLTQVARFETKEEVTLSYLSKLENTANGMNKLLNKLSMVNIINQSDAQIDLIDFEAIIEKCLRQQQHYLEKNPINLATEIEEGIRFYSEISMIELILINLLENAILFHSPTNQKEPFIELKIYVEDKYLIIKILDNGIGINQEVAHKIYDMFFRGSEVSTGNGLGLYLVKKAVNRLKGSIEMESKEWFYTSFTVSIPIVGAS